MRRRRHEDVPPRLAAFVPTDWPGTGWEDRFQLWREARQVWAEQHDGWPGGTLALVRGESDARRRHDGLPLRSMGRSRLELALVDPEHLDVHLGVRDHLI